jgi:hypothetical protein
MSLRTHLLVLAVCVLCLGFVISLVRRRLLRAKYSILWLSVGVVLAVLAASPKILDRVSKLLGISYGPTTFFLGAIILVFFVIVQFSYELSRLEERSRTLAEEVAILRLQLSRPPAAPPLPSRPAVEDRTGSAPSAADGAGN